MHAQTLDELAAQLGRPAGTLATFPGMSPEQIAVLSAAIENTRQRQRRILDRGEGAAWYARWLVRLLVKLLRR